MALKTLGKKPEVFLLTGKEDDEFIAEHIRSKITQYDSDNKQTARQWMVNAAMARGNQFSVLHEHDDRLIQLKPPPGRKMIMDDMIGPWKEHIIANLTVTRPEWEPIPETYGYVDIMAAGVARDLLAYLWDAWEFQVQQIDIASNIVVYANCIVLLNTVDDKYISRLMRYTGSNDIVYGDDGIPRSEKVRITDISATILPPHCWIGPLDPTPMDSKPWMGIRQSKPLSYFKRYGKVGEEVQAGVFNSNGSYDINQISRGLRDRRGYPASANEVIYIQKPCDESPDGLTIIYANGRVLNDKKNREWAWGKIESNPVVHFHGVKEVGEFWARSSIERQIPLQKYLNLLRSAMGDNTDNMAHLKWLIHEGANVDKITDINEIVRWGGTIEPKMMEINPLPQWIAEERESVRSAIRDLQNYHGASMGQSVSGVRSDLHAQNLQDQDLMPLSIVDNLMTSAYASMATKILSLAAEKLPEERILSFIRDSNPIVIENFKGAMLGNVRRVKVRMVDGRLRSKGAVKQEVAQWFSAGILSDDFGQPDPNEAKMLLEFALPDSVFAEQRLHRSRAHIENARMMNGEPMNPYPIQNHPIHLKEHRRHMNSPAFMELIELSERGDASAQTIVNLFFMHIQLTSQMLLDAMPKPQVPPNGTSEGQAGQQPPKPASQNGEQ